MSTGSSGSHRNVNSAPVGAAGSPTQVPVGGGPSLLRNPRWGNSEHAHGEEAEMLVDGPGLDGRTVRFVVEHSVNGQWQQLAETTGVIQSGTARGRVRLEHPAERQRRDLTFREGTDVGPRTIRFSATLV